MKRFVLWRMDDNGNEFVVARYERREDAEAARDRYDARGHKQMYWVAIERR